MRCYINTQGLEHDTDSRRSSPAEDTGWRENWALRSWESTDSDGEKWRLRKEKSKISEIFEIGEYQTGYI